MMAQIREHLALLEAGTELTVTDVYGLTFPTPYPTNKPTAPPIEPARSIALQLIHADRANVCISLNV